MHNDINIFITRSNVCRFLWIPLVYRTTRVYVFITLLNRSSFVLFIFFFPLHVHVPRVVSPSCLGRISGGTCVRASDNRLGSLGNDRSNYQATLMGNLHDTVALRGTNGGCARAVIVCAKTELLRDTIEREILRRIPGHGKRKR